MAERRRAKRYSLCLRAVGRYFPPGQQLHELYGDTFDVSRNGVYLVTDHMVPEGTPIDLELELPIAGEDGNPIRVRCQARVVRTDPPAQVILDTPMVGLACAIERIYSYAGLREDKANLAATA